MEVGGEFVSLHGAYSLYTHSTRLCKEYLNTAIFHISVLLLIKNWTFEYIECLPMSSHTGVVHFKLVGFFLAHPVNEEWESHWLSTVTVLITQLHFISPAACCRWLMAMCHWDAVHGAVLAEQCTLTDIKQCCTGVVRNRDLGCF